MQNFLLLLVLVSKKSRKEFRTKNKFDFIVHSMRDLNEFLRIFLTTLYIYWIGFSYSVREFFADRRWREFLAVSADKPSQSEEEILLENWRKTLLGKENSSDYRNVAVITGADGTIGVEILELLTSLGFFSICVGLHEPGRNFANSTFLRCDLRDSAQVKDCAKSIRALTPNVDILVCAAGVMFSRQDANGELIEPHLTVNVLAHALLFRELRAQMEASSWRFPRAIILSSSTCRAGSIAEYLSANECVWRRQISGYKSYADSKLLLSLYVDYLGNNLLRREDSKICAVSAHPGVVPGRLYRHVFGPIRFFINALLAPFLRTGRLAAIRVLKLAFSEDPKNGAYFEDGETPISLPNHQKDAKFLEKVGKVVEEWIEKFVE